MKLITPLSLQQPERFKLDFELLQEFEEGLDPRKPEQNELPCKVLGYGEISTVFAIQVPGLEGLALKRMVLFDTEAELTTYLEAYHRYNQLLAEIGLTLPDHGHAAFLGSDGRPVFYIIQQQLSAGSIGSQVIHELGSDQALALFRQVLQLIYQGWLFNKGQDDLEVALDAQISNWALASPEGWPEAGVDASELLYIDTSTPLFRIQGAEQLNAELFLRLAPSFLRWFMRRFFLDDVMNRYYDVRLVIIDLIANLYKEQRSVLIPDFILEANEFCGQELAAANIEPISEKEVAAYYREDAFIWSLYTGMRRLDRFLHRLFRQPYVHILPGKTKR